MLLPSIEQIDLDVQAALQEDLGNEDITAALLPEHLKIEAHILSREAMVVCGQSWVTQSFLMIDPTIEIKWLVKEGQYLASQTLLCILRGSARAILTAERTALNFLQTLSGTATTTYTFVEQLKGSQTRLLDTRKTIPGLRLAQKYAVRCGGGVNHRFGLYDAFLIKENHISAIGSITAAIYQARTLYPERFLEVEVETLAELQEAMDAKPDRILLDNFNLEILKQAVKLVKQKIPLEVSGGVERENLSLIASTGVDYISVGAITKHLHAIDLSLLVKDNL